MTTHTLGAIKAAEVITGGSYGDTTKRYPTTYGDKTVEGIAAIIDEVVTDLLGAAQARVDEWHTNVRNLERDEPLSLKLARAAIARATNRKDDR